MSDNFEARAKSRFADADSPIRSDRHGSPAIACRVCERGMLTPTSAPRFGRLAWLAGWTHIVIGLLVLLFSFYVLAVWSAETRQGIGRFEAFLITFAAGASCVALGAVASSVRAIFRCTACGASTDRA